MLEFINQGAELLGGGFTFAAGVLYARWDNMGNIIHHDNWVIKIYWAPGHYEFFKEILQRAHFDPVALDCAQRLYYNKLNELDEIFFRWDRPIKCWYGGHHPEIYYEEERERYHEDQLEEELDDIMLEEEILKEIENEMQKKILREIEKEIQEEYVWEIEQEEIMNDIKMIEGEEERWLREIDLIKKEKTDVVIVKDAELSVKGKVEAGEEKMYKKKILKSSEKDPERKPKAKENAQNESFLDDSEPQSDNSEVDKHSTAETSPEKLPKRSKASSRHNNFKAKEVGTPKLDRKIQNKRHENALVKALAKTTKTSKNRENRKVKKAARKNGICALQDQTTLFKVSKLVSV